MQAVVKTPRIEINIKGEIPDRLLSVLQEEFGNDVRISDRADEVVDIFATDWYRDIKAKIRPGDNLKIYRQNHDMTQAELGQKLGNIPRQHISNMERGIRTISLKNARKLAIIFGVSPEKFI